MKYRTTNIILILFLYVVFLLSTFTAKRAYYLATERPSVTYFNRKYATNVGLTALRYSRRDPWYYLNMFADVTIDFDNNVTVNFYAIQFPNNGPILMELHYKWCNMITNDEIMGPFIKKYIPPTCPTPKGKYQVSNVTTAHIPSVFIEHLPFTKARLYCNATIFNEKLVAGHIDIETLYQPRVLTYWK